MSVKKLGKAKFVWHKFGFSAILFCCKVEGVNDEFCAYEFVGKNIHEIQELGSRPPKPSRYENNSEKNEYEEKIKEFHKKEEEATKKTFDRLLIEYQNKPLRLSNLSDKFWSSEENDIVNLVYCFYKNTVYKFDRANYSEEEMILQIMELEDEERKRFERLKHKFTIAEQEERGGKRPAIPEEVRVTVWHRDGGKCVKCGSRENLEYDHIIPISKGGSNTVRNIELLCEKCNRGKSDSIA